MAFLPCRGSLRVVQLRGGSRIGDSRLGAVRAKGAAVRGVWGMMTRHAYKLQSLLQICYAKLVVRSRRILTVDRTPNPDLIIPAAP